MKPKQTQTVLKYCLPKKPWLLLWHCQWIPYPADWVRDFPVDLYRLRDKYCSGPHPKVLHGAPSLDHIFQELYAVPEQIKLPCFRIKVLELLLYLDALELDGRTEKPYFSSIWMPWNCPWSRRSPTSTRRRWRK